MATNSVSISIDGDTDELVLPQGVYKLEITATEWDGATATLKEVGVGTAVAVDDPYNAGNALARTANGKMIETRGGTKFLLTVSGAGESTDSVTLTAHRAE